jgi:hypothetical protein
MSHSICIARSSAALALVGALWWAPATADARPRFRLPEECGSEEELRAELVRLLGQGGARALPRSLVIVRTEESYELELELDDESRTLRDPDCRVLFKTAVVVAVAFVRQPSRPSAGPALDTAAAARATDAEGPQSVSDLRPAWHGEVWVGAGAAFGLLPGASALFELSGTLMRDNFGMGVGARYLAGSEGRFGSDGVGIGGFGARAFALYEPVNLLRVQAGIVADRLTGRGFGNEVDERTGSGMALGLALELGMVALRAGPARLSIDVAGQYALVRPSFEIAGRGEVFRTAALGASGVARLGWTFR